MKILMINSVCGIRSTGRICTDIAEVLDKEGHDVKIAYGRENVPERFKKYAVKIGSDFGVKLHAVRSRLFDASGFGSRIATKRFIKWVKSYDPDIIHLHNIHGYYLNIEILFDYLKASEKPVVWTLHDCWAFTGHCSHFDFVGCEKWKMGCVDCPQKLTYPKSFVDRSSRNYDRKKRAFTSVKNLSIVTPSHWLADLVRESYLAASDVLVVHNGINLNVFKPTDGNFRKEHSIEEKKILLGVASVWGKRKGFDDFIKMSQMLDDSYRIVLVGVSEQQKEKLHGNMIGINRTNNTKELAHIYTTADVFVNPTYEDNYPTVNLEAIACGTPVITYSTGGSPEAVREYEGMTVPKGDVDALVNGIYTLTRGGKRTLNNAELNSMSVFNFVEEYYDIYNRSQTV
ncbi:MAG: glycosyltransferase [Clostridia bacterium]|nr:glycosyltransferase [Clostridia bacterium]